MSYYAVRKGRRTGIFETWNEIHPLIDKFVGASFKKFKTQKEAEDFVADNHECTRTLVKQTKMTMFFKKKDTAGPVTPPSMSTSTSNREGQPKKLITLKKLVNGPSSSITSTSGGISLFAEKEKVYAYCDGSTFNNGKKNASGGIGIWFGHGHKNNVSEPYTIEVPTNQRTELYALAKTMKILDGFANNNPDKKYEFHIYTDSEYSYKNVTQRIPAWIQNGWITKSGTPVKNKQLNEELHKIYNKRRFVLHHVRAHTGATDQHSIGNDMADKLAVNGSKMHPKYQNR